ncbi:hypothetical protein HanIR_Chr17g0877821 [Helianthus annuus]|nr:hypothetical protein HanIR_Chr17g0877821 [Helianthus annuus]
MTCILVEITIKIRVLTLLVRHWLWSFEIMILCHKNHVRCVDQRSPVLFSVLVLDRLAVTDSIDGVARVLLESRPLACPIL